MNKFTIINRDNINANFKKILLNFDRKHELRFLRHEIRVFVKALNTVSFRALLPKRLSNLEFRPTTKTAVPREIRRQSKLQPTPADSARSVFEPV